MRFYLGQSPSMFVLKLACQWLSQQVNKESRKKSFSTDGQAIKA